MVPVTIGSILFGLAILILLFLFLVRPFMKAPPQAEAVSRRQEQLARKGAILDAIRALDFDHDTGKLPDEEYEKQRTALMEEATVTLKALDELPTESVDGDVYMQIEEAASRIRQQRAASAGTPALFCTNCGQGLESGDKFCAQCGQPVYDPALNRRTQPST